MCKLACCTISHAMHCDENLVYLLNFCFRDEEEKDILIDDPKKGTTKINVLAKSINTMKYW